MKQLKVFGYLGSVLTENRKFGTEMRTSIDQSKERFQQLTIVLRNRKKCQKERKDCLCQPYSYMAVNQRRQKYILRIPWTGRKQLEILEENAKRTNTFTLKQEKAAGISGRDKEGGLENLTLTDPIEDKRNSGRHRSTYLTGLCEQKAE